MARYSPLHAYNINATALNVLTAQLLLHYPHLKVLSEASPGVRRVEECAAQAKVETAELLECACKRKEASKEESNIDKALQRQMALIEQLIDHNKALSKHIRAIESGNEPTEETPAAQELDKAVSKAPKRARKSPTTHLSDAWFGWYTSEPQLWMSDDSKRKSLLKQAVGFMKLFLVDGFSLNESTTGYKDRVLEYGQQTGNEAIVFLCTKRIESRGVGVVVRHFREL